MPGTVAGASDGTALKTEDGSPQQGRDRGLESFYEPPIFGHKPESSKNGITEGGSRAEAPTSWWSRCSTSAQGRRRGWRSYVLTRKS
jgi:hypothetical protein